MSNKRIKPLSAEYNNVGGYDLYIERDAGNLFRVLTGNKKLSKEYWRRIHNLSKKVLENLDNDIDMPPFDEWKIKG